MGVTDPLNSTLTFSYNGFFKVTDWLRVLLELMVKVAFACSKSLITDKLVVFFTSAWMAPVARSLTVVSLNSYIYTYVKI